MMMIPPPGGAQAPVINQSPQSSLASMLAPQRPVSSASLIDPSKMMDMVKLARSLRDPDKPAYQGAPTDPGMSNMDMSGNVMDPNRPGGNLVNGLAGSEGLFGSNGFLQRQLGAQPSAMNAYNGPGIGAAPASAMMTPTGFAGG